ncbi:MAG: type I polyketide synthase, partial [Pseudomonadales bacterium]
MPNKKQRIAIVGMAFRFPGDIDCQEKFWNALTTRQDLVTEVGADRWDSSILKHSRKTEAGKSYVFSAGQLSRIQEFDAQFFGISPREAAQMDPQQRLLLELSWEAMENAAVNPETLEGSDTAVYVGIASTDYAQRRMDDLSSADAYSMTGATASIASNRISYIFDLHGPSMSIDTACSSSLVALHQACNSIWEGEASKALVGGVNLLLHPFGFVGFSKASMLSPNGRCRAFDAAGDGYVRSEGCAVLYLKPLEQAEKDGDRIHAVIVNTGVNSDGRTNGITMPSFAGQSALLKKIYEDADINVNEIDYIEAHGTGTSVGDPIEATAIGETLARLRSHKHFLPIGSVKTNLGHMETASGMAGMVKTILCLKHRAVPPNLHFDNPNPNIDFDGLNISVVDQLSEFPESEKALIAGVNSFGFGGANSHVILEEYRDTRERSTEIPEEIETPPLFLSAACPVALKQMAEQYADFLRTNSAWYYDIAYQLAHKHAHLNNGLAVKAKSVSGLIRALRSYIEGAENSPVVTQTLVKKNAALAFIYSGNGSQWLGMGRQLYAADALFAEKLEDVDRLLSEHVNYSIIDEMHAEPESSKFHLTEIAQPALFAIQVGITEWLSAKGIKPKAVAGHSVGEVTAAWAAGALSLKQAVQVIVERSAAQGMTRGTGRMAALGLSREDSLDMIKELRLGDQVEIAGENSPKSVTLAGALPALQQLESAALQKDIFYRILDLDYAFHSKYME